MFLKPKKLDKGISYYIQTQNGVIANGFLPKVLKFKQNGVIANGFLPKVLKFKQKCWIR